MVTSSTLNSVHADRTKPRGRWQVGDAKDAPVDDAAVDIAGTPTDAGLRRRRRQRRELKKDDKKDDKKDSKKEEKKGGGTSASSASTNVGAGNNAAKQQKNNAEKETAVISNMAGTGNMSPVITSVKPPKDDKDAKDKKGDKKGGGGDKIKNNAKQKNDKNMETGMYAGTFNYAAVRPQAWNPSAVTLGSAQTSNTNYASPGAATGNMVAGNAVSSAGVYRVSQILLLHCGIIIYIVPDS